MSQFYRWKDPTQPPQAPALYLYFEQEPQVNTAVTAETGVQSYDNVLIAYVASKPQDKSNVAHEIRRTLPDGTVVENREKAFKYAEPLKHYDAGAEAESLGTPLRELIGMTPATIMNLKARGIATVESLAELPDSSGNELMGFWEFRDKARRHIELREKNAPMLRMEAIEEAHKRETDALKKQIEDLTALVTKRGPGRPRKDELEQEAA